MTIMLLLGGGLLASQTARYEGVLYAGQSTQAKALALAGMEDARVKLEKDWNFPPRPGPGQFLFTYSERMTLPNPAPFDQGSYTVIIDLSRTVDPNNYGVIQIASIGSLGPADEPIAQYRINAELDVRPPVSSPTYFRFLRWEDEGGL